VDKEEVSFIWSFSAKYTRHCCKFFSSSAESSAPVVCQRCQLRVQQLV
jgi:hypothetical protein